MVIKHARKVREYRPPELPHFSVDDYCAETNKIYDFFGCHCNGSPYQTFREVITANGDNLSARYEHTMARLEQLYCAGYQVKVQWEWEFDDDGIATPELRAQTTVRQSPLCNRDAHYGGRNEAMCLHYKSREGVTILYVEVLSLYPYISEYIKVPVGYPVIHVGDAYKERKPVCARMA